MTEYNPRVQSQLPADKRPRLDDHPNLHQIDDKLSVPEIHGVTVWPETDDGKICQQHNIPAGGEQKPGRREGGCHARPRSPYAQNVSR